MASQLIRSRSANPSAATTPRQRESSSSNNGGEEYDGADGSSGGSGGNNNDNGGEFLTLDFSPNRETVHRWRKLPNCDEFVGARRSKHTSVAYKGAIYVFGGDNGKQMLNDMIRFDLSDLSWGRAFTMGTLPAPRYHHTAVVHESSMYIFGGYTGDIHNNSNLTNKNDLYEYKFSTGQWSLVRVDTQLPPARSAHGAAVYDDKLWIFGGFDGHKRLNDMWKISLSGPIRHWEEVEQTGDIPPPCCNFSFTVHEHCLYVFSGQSGAKSTNSLFQFQFRQTSGGPPAGSWKKLSTEHVLRAASQPPNRRYGHTMVAHQNHLYVLGGAAENIYEPGLHSYDLVTHTWSNIPPPDLGVAGGGAGGGRAAPGKGPSGRLFHSTVVINDSMYVFGGTVESNIRSSEIYRFQFSSHPRCTLHEDFGRLLENRQLCDLRFNVGKDRVPIYAHIPIVAARSVFLRNKIKEARESQADQAEAHLQDVPGGPLNHHAPHLNNSPFSPKSKELNILDVNVADAEPFAFEMVLAYIYTDKIDPTQRGQEPLSNAVVLLMMEVYRLSLQFSMKRLESLAIQYLESMVGLKNVLVALQSACRLELPYIKEFCFKFITKEGNFNHIVMSKDFETLEQPLMVELIRRRQNVRAMINEPQPKRIIEGNSLEADMEAFLEGGVGADFCDITLTANNISITVHKVILAARSAYFEAMFRNWMPETNQVEVQLGDVVPSAKAFRSLLRYIYFGATDMPPEDSLFLFAAPPFYGFSNNRLQVFCKENLETNIRTDNVLEILEAAHKIQANEMKRHCLSILVVNFSRVATQDKLRSLDRELLLDIIQAVAEGNPSMNNIPPSPTTLGSSSVGGSGGGGSAGAQGGSQAIAGSSSNI